MFLLRLCFVLIIVGCIQPSVKAQTHPSAEAVRFARGAISGEPEYQASVIPADQQKGLKLDETGNTESLYGNIADYQRPWFFRIQRTNIWQFAQNPNYYMEVENPVAAFGELSGGTPLYTNTDYRFGVISGGRDASHRGIFRIRAYARNALMSGEVSVAPVDELTFELPIPGDSTWDQFLIDGGKKVVDFHGLRSTIQIVGGANTLHTSETRWGGYTDPYLITQRSTSTDFFFVVEYKGWIVVGGQNIPLGRSDLTTSAQAAFCPLYCLDFSNLPAWRSSFIHSPHFEGIPVPSWYYGKSLEELQGAWGYSPGSPPSTMKTVSVDQSAELRSHPELDKLIDRLGGNPIALTNYVFNEIELVDPMGYNENGQLDNSSVSAGGLSRSALGTYLEGEGNPWEQCALLVYLLRKAGVPAVYCEPENGKQRFLDTQLSKILRMQIKGAQMPAGGALMPTLVDVNFPWVSAWIDSENRWVNLFPWLKDTEVIERGNLFDQFPADCKTGQQWVKRYLQGDLEIVPEQVGIYQQESGIDKLAVMEAEGYHENAAVGGLRWEPLDDGGPPGYSGLGWMKVKGPTSTMLTAPNSPRLDFKVNFSTSGTHYVFVRGCSGTSGSQTAVHVGIDGQVSTTADNVKINDSFQWSNVDSSSALLTINVPTAGKHTVNVWAAQRTAYFDKILLTTNPSYIPSIEPAISSQSKVELNVPSNLFPRYAQLHLQNGVSLSDYGVSYRDRFHERLNWDEFPKPFQLLPGNTQFYASLAERANTFDSIRVQVWSDRNGDGIYNGPSVDSAFMDTGDWYAADLQNRRFYLASKKTGSNTHQLRLMLAPYRPAVTGTGDFSQSNSLSEQLLSANLTSNDEKIQFEITRSAQKRVTKYGVYHVDITNGGAGYLSPPTVIIAAPPSGSGHRTATATAEILGGKVSAIKILDPGYGYSTVPAISLVGGLLGSGAQATAKLENAISRWVHPLGIQVKQIIAQKPNSIRKGDLAAICLNYGRVSDRMVQLQADDLWKAEREMKLDPAKASDEEFLERTKATSCFLMGQSYYNKTGKFGAKLERLNKVHILGAFSAGLSKLLPYRDASGMLPNNGEIVPRMAAVDMFLTVSSFAANGSLHPDSGLLYTEAAENFWPLYIAEISAQEHAIINEYFGESAAISTVKLLQRANTSTGGIRMLTKQNFAAEGNVNYTYAGITKTLKTWDPLIWSEVVSAFQSADRDSAQVLITAGPIASASASYTGLGAMILTPNNYSALISNSMGLTNGGFSSDFVTPRFNSINLSNNYLEFGVGGYHLNYSHGSNSVSQIYTPSQSTYWSLGSTANTLGSSISVSSPTFNNYLVSNSYSLGISSINYGEIFHNISSVGTTGNSSFYGSISPVGNWIGDPVNAVTGEFYIDAVDLTLPGPFPLEVRRTYASQSLSNNDFGYGWKLAYFPYLVVALTGDVIYAAEMDGSVIAYRRDPTDSTGSRYIPKLEDNPNIKNLHSGGIGSAGNVMNNYIVTSNSNAVYTLYGSNGQERRFEVDAFPVGSGSDTITRSRPYLKTWKDAHGNKLTFQFDGDSQSPGYGCLNKIVSTNGNFLGLEYDVYGHVTEIWTNDGRRVKYGYDSQGDLRTATLPDNSVQSYDYEQETTTVGAESVQTSKHLLVRETKPGNRILENVYRDHDSNPATPERVVEQKAVVGDSSSPVRNATFIYQSSIADPAPAKTVSGVTKILDAYDRETIISFSRSMITSEDDPETPAEIREWYQDGDSSAGAYPRSLKRIVDRRGVTTLLKYDNKGNLKERSLGTDSAPADLDGDGVASEKAITQWAYNSLNLPETEIDPVGNLTKWFYENPSYPYLATRVEHWAGGQLISSDKKVFYEKTGLQSAFGLLQLERIAADSSDEAKTEWEHDNRGYPSRRTQYTNTPDPPVIADLTYNSRGELRYEKDSLNRIWTYDYDPMGRRTAEERRNAAGNLIYWNYTYYTLNGEVEWTDGPQYNPEDYTWHRYDGNGRKTEEIRWLSAPFSSGVGMAAPMGDDLTSNTFYRYNLFNDLIEIRSPRRNSIWMDYDGIGRLKRREFFEGYKTVGVLKAYEEFYYENGGEVSSHRDVLGGWTTNFYNARGQLRRRTNPDSSMEEFRYYLDGRIQKEILRNGSYWETTYDDSQRSVTRVLKAGASSLKTEIKKFDRRQNCIEETSDGFTWQHSYDALGRLKTNIGPVANSTSARQSMTVAYNDGANREEERTNGLNEKTRILRDELGRIESEETKNAQGQVELKTTTVYSPDHTKKTFTVGTGSHAIETQTWVDTFGHIGLVRRSDGTSEFNVYDTGGLLRWHIDRLGLSSYYSRNWRGDIVNETRDDQVEISYEHDAMGNLLSFQSLGGISEAAQYDSAGRMEWKKQVEGGNGTRLTTYTYYPSNSTYAGLLDTVTDARGIVTKHSYDGALRVHTQTTAGPTAEFNGSRTFLYNERDMLRKMSEEGAGGTTEVNRNYDGYGAISSETVKLNGNTLANSTQHFDAGGNRWKLQGVGDDRTFTYRADGLMTGTTVSGSLYATTYHDNGYISSRSNPFRTVSVADRDGLGRIKDLRTSVGGAEVMKEVVPVWNAGDKINNLYSTRGGSGAWNENRDFGYDISKRLFYEDFTPRPGASEEVIQSYYDGGNIAQTGGIGILTRRQSVLPGTSDSPLNTVPSIAMFSRVTNEEIFSQPRVLTLSGVANGAAKVNLTLDGQPVLPVHYGGWRDLTGNWTAQVKIAPGVHQLKAEATHPSGWVAPPATSSFIVQPHGESLTNGYDGMGNVVTRSWSGGKSQILSWDAWGRLVKIVQTGGTDTSFTWTALYDGLNRRISTTYTPISGPETKTSSIYDPAVEFLELGTGVQVEGGTNAWSWKIYGPDISGTYGGLQGLGGLEAVIGKFGLTKGIINDWWGNVVGWVNEPGQSIKWAPSYYLAWGPAPGRGPASFDGNKPLHEGLGYRGLTTDPSGYIHQGLRDYDPSVGRWLSPDPMGQAGSLSLYDYCDNDPNNVFDLDGRFGKGVYEGVTSSASGLITAVSNPSQTWNSIGTNLSNIGYGLSGITSDIGNGHISNYGQPIWEGLSEGARNLTDGRKLGTTWGQVAFAAATWEAGGVAINSGKAFTGGLVSASGNSAVGVTAQISVNAAKAPSTALSTFRQTTAGESFLHYGYAEQAAGFAGGLRPGGFATTASGLTGAEARAGLALPRAVPPNAVYTVTPTLGTTIRVNPVTSPQFGQPGGLPEFQFPLGTGPGTISSPRPIP